MTIALFSDVHANFPAFEAMLADLDRRNVDAVYCLGDLVGYNIWPNEVIAAVRKRRIAAIAGNHDLKVIKLSADAQGNAYAYHIVSADAREYLTTLPAHIRLEFKWGSVPFNIMLAHGSPRSNEEYILADTDEKYVLDLMQEAGADMLCVGHSHKPYHRMIKTDTGVAKHIINIGSVGKPKDGNPDGCYVILTLNLSGALQESESVSVEFIRVAYDVEQVAQAIEQSPLPDELADRLRNAY